MAERLLGFVKVSMRNDSAVQVKFTSVGQRLLLLGDCREIDTLNTFLLRIFIKKTLTILLLVVIL